ncbi:MAG TPA: hypothetical protein VGB67_10080 [Fibrella sp.]
MHDPLNDTCIENPLYTVDPSDVNVTVTGIPGGLLTANDPVPV